VFSTDVFSTDLHDRQAQNLVRSLVFVFVGGGDFVYEIQI